MVPAANAQTLSASVPPATTSPPPTSVQVPATQETVNSLELFLGETTTLTRSSVKRVIVGKSEVLSATALPNGDVVLAPRGAGRTSLEILNTSGTRERWVVRVLPVDTARIAAEIQGFLGQMSNVNVRTIAEKVIVDGVDLSELQLFKIAELAKSYPQVVNLTAFQKDRAWEKMVLIDVQVVEVARNHTRDFGIRWESSFEGPHVQPFKGRIGLASGIDSTIAILESQGEAIVLADPQLATRSGKKASFLSGGEIPYQAINQDGSAQITFKKFGVELEVTPLATDSGSILSSVRAMVSEPDASINPLSGVPGLRSREADTWFNVKSGETMVIAGLLQHNSGKSSDQVPHLGSIPVLGHLFKAKKNDHRETELVIFLTARTVEPGDSSLARVQEIVRRDAEQSLSESIPVPMPEDAP